MTAANDYGPQFTVGGLTFNSTADDADIPLNGTGWWASLSGWDAAPRRIVTTPNITEDGDTPVDMTLAPRVLTIRGWCRVHSADPTAALYAARDQFLRATLASPAALVSLTVQESPPTTAMVHSSDDPPQWDRRACDNADVTGIAYFVAGLVVPDGVKYAQAVVTTALGAGIATPAPTSSPSSTGGTLTAGTYSYRVSAVNASGETVASAPVQASLAPLPTPGSPALTASATGSLAPGAYGYRVSAVNANGQTLASTEAIIAVGASGNVISITVAWAPVAGATGYNVYGRSLGNHAKLTPTPVVGTSFVDTGAVTPSGAVPTSNTTGTTTGSVVIAWSAVPGATGYNVYGRTVGGELKMTPTPITGTSFTDTGSVTPSGAPPGTGFATTITNTGSYETEPTLTVAGPGATSPITLTIGSRSLRLNTSLASGQTLTVNMATKAVTINGVLRRDIVDNASQWPALAPGANAVVYSGGGTASLAHQAAYA